MDNGEAVFVPDAVDFQTRHTYTADNRKGPSDWSFRDRPEITGTLYYPDGRQKRVSVPVTNAEDAVLRRLLVTAGARAAAEDKTK